MYTTNVNVTYTLQCLALCHCNYFVLWCTRVYTHCRCVYIIMYMGVQSLVARSILLTNSAPTFLEYGKNIHTLIAIDTMHAGLHKLTAYCMLVSVLLAYPECIHHQCNTMHCLCIYMAWRLFAGELHVTLLCASEPVICRHLLASNTAGQVWWRPWERPEIAIEVVTSLELLKSWKWRGYCQANTILIMTIPSLSTPSRPASEREQQWTRMK
jgi:hypothetical protein